LNRSHDEVYWDPYEDWVYKEELKSKHEFSPSLLYSSALVGNSDYLN